MKKRYKVPIVDEEGKQESAEVVYDTDKQQVEILASWEAIILSFDTLDQLKYQLDDVRKLG